MQIKKEIFYQENSYSILKNKFVSKKIKRKVKKYIKYCKKYFSIKGKVRVYFVENDEGLLGEYIVNSNKIMIMLKNIINSEEDLPFNQLLFSVVVHETLHIFFNQTFPTMQLEDQEQLIYKLEEELWRKKYQSS